MAASTESSCYSNVLLKFNSYTKNPETFLSIHDGSGFVHLTKELYDVQARVSHGELNFLVVEAFDDEQVWQQLELRNGAVLKESLTAVSQLATLRSSPSLGIDFPSHQCVQESSVEFVTSQEPVEVCLPKSQVISEREAAPSGCSRQGEDRFFSLSQMNAFLDSEEAHDSEDSEGSVDYFGELPSEDEVGKSGKNATYEDFFSPPGVESTQESEKGRTGSRHDQDEECALDSGGDEVLEDNVKSTFEVGRQMVKKQIQRLEDYNIKEKPWNLQGEVEAQNRPENSLLQEHLQFDHMTRQAPAITEETTRQFERIILDRMRDKAWDDVERKHKPTEEPFEFRRRVALDQEKSKLSLAQVYEQQFIKQNSQVQKEDPAHEEIRTLMSSLFTKLDALSNFHLLPKRVSSELKIVSNLPSVTVEEVTPISMTDAQLLAPEEVKEKPHKEVVEEKTKSRRLRERRIKRARRKAKQAVPDKKGNKEEAVRKVLRGSSAKLLKEGEKTTLSSSKKFFEALQHKTIRVAEKPTKKKKTSPEAVALKL